jgi:hypothetical protein
MAAPNIANLTTIYGQTAGLAVPITPTAIVTNTAASGKVYKLNALFISNVDGTGNYTVTVDVYKAGTTAYRIGYLIVVPAAATLDVLSRIVYLEEGDSLRLTASVVNKLEAVCSYEVMS